MGKYDKFIDTLPKFVGKVDDTPNRRELINREKDKLRTMCATGVDIAQLYLNARLRKAQLKAKQSPVNLRIAALEELLVASQEQQQAGWGDYGTSDRTVRLVTGETVAVQPEPYAKVIDRDLVRLWAIKTGLERALALPWGSLNSHLKELLVLGEPAPDGVQAMNHVKVILKGMVKPVPSVDFDEEDDEEDQAF